MFYTNEGSPKRIVEIIESVDGALLFNSKEKLEKVMASINFKLSTDYSQDYETYSNYIYSGIIHKHTVHLNYLHYPKSDSIVLGCKFYMKIDGEFLNGIRHREHDLPAILQYSDKTGEVACMEYYIDNIRRRIEHKPVLITFYEGESNERFFRYYQLDDFSGENFSIYSAHLMDNKIIDASFCYHNNLISLSEIAEIVPEVEHLKIAELETLKSNSLLSEELRCLLDMNRI